MAVEKSYARLGLLLVIVLLVALGTALFFIKRMEKHAVIAAVTYTNENVSGIDVSSPVRFRGVPVGRVTNVRVNTQTNNVEIDFEVFLDRLAAIGADVKRILATARTGLFEKARAQVVQNPLTGEAYLLLDRFENPPPAMVLGFTPDRAYIPSMPTMMSKVEDRLPAFLERADKAVDTLTEIIARLPKSLDRTDLFFTNVEKTIRASQLPALSADSRKFLTTTTAQLDQMDRMTADMKKLIEVQMEQMTSEMKRMIEVQETFTKLAEETRKTIFASELPATTQMARDTLGQTSMAAEDLRRSLPAIREALEQMRELARQLDDQPESVVYGPRPTKVKTK